MDEEFTRSPDRVPEAAQLWIGRGRASQGRGLLTAAPRVRLASTASPNKAISIAVLSPPFDRRARVLFYHLSVNSVESIPFSCDHAGSQVFVRA
jgi:hypothetical protein